MRVFLTALDPGMAVRQRRLEVVRDVLVESWYCSSVISDFGRAHSAEAWLICSSSSVRPARARSNPIPPSSSEWAR